MLEFFLLYSPLLIRPLFLPSLLGVKDSIVSRCVRPSPIGGFTEKSFKYIFPRPSVRFIDYKHPLEQLFRLRGALRNPQWAFHDIAKEVLLGIAVVGQLPEEELIEHHPQRPHISFASVVLLTKNLRRHVDGRSYKGSSHAACLSEQLCKAKIADFENFLMNENIGWLEVSMEDS